MKTTTKRILVTGGAGFLGSHLCERLISFLALPGRSSRAQDGRVR
jgi:nucleoside-diphosphate-sugar epimerase